MKISSLKERDLMFRGFLSQVSFCWSSLVTSMALICDVVSFVRQMHTLRQCLLLSVYIREIPWGQTVERRGGSRVGQGRSPAVMKAQPGSLHWPYGWLWNWKDLSEMCHSGPNFPVLYTLINHCLQATPERVWLWVMGFSGTEVGEVPEGVERKGHSVHSWGHKNFLVTFSKSSGL